MTIIKLRRGNKADLPASAPSGVPLWCEDTKELYIGTDSGITPIGMNNIYSPCFAPYSVNSGNVDASGYPDLINKVSNTEVSFKVGGSYPNMGITFPNGNHYIISSIANSSGLSADGTYTFIIEEENLTKLSDGTYSASVIAVKLGYSYDGNNVIPAMTSDGSNYNLSNDSNGWTISASSARDLTPHNPAWNPYYACDGNLSTNFMSAAYTGWWKALKNSGTFTTKKIGIRCDTAQYGMRNFTIRDQDNNILVTVTDAIWVAGVINNYELPAEFTGTGIILNITASYNGYTFQIDEVAIYEHLVSVGGNITEGFTYPESADISIVPAMTSNTSGGWTASASSYSQEALSPWHVFDGITPVGFVNGWESNFTSSGWLKIAKDSGIFNLSRIAISSCHNGPAAPRDFTIQDQAGNILKTINGENWLPYETKYYDVAATGISAVKIDVTANNGQAYIDIGEVKLYSSINSIDGDYTFLMNQIPYKSQKRTNGYWLDKQFLKLGEATKTGGILGIAKNYVFNRKFYKKINCPVYSTKTDITHNLGTNNIKITAYLVCKISELGYLVGQKAQFITYSSNLSVPGFIIKDKNTVSFVSGNQNLIVQQNGSPYYYAIINPANWDLETVIEGNF